MRLKFLAAMAVAAAIASPASASVVLDQATIPESGNIPFSGGVLWGVGPNALGQTFTVGVTGMLDSVALGLEIFNAPGGDTRLEIVNASNAVLFTHVIPISALPTLTFSGIDASAAPVVDVRSAAIMVSAGDVLMLKLTGLSSGGYANWRANNAGGLINYSGGQAYVFDLPGFPSPFQIGNEFAFRTYVDDLASAVPEPATWAMMIVGFAGVGAALRRSRRNLVVA